MAERALTLHQPWASLVALGVKTIETRSWSTKYRGPLAIHAGRRRLGDWYHSLPMNQLVTAARMAARWQTHPTKLAERFPLGAIVATCELVDVVPIIDPDDCEWHIEHPRSVGACAHAALHDQVILHTPEGRHHTTVLVESPYGDFTPGRYAWLLDKVEPVDPPVPCKGRQGLWEWTRG